MSSFINRTQKNGQAETANMVLLRRLRQRLDEAKENWVEEYNTPNTTKLDGIISSSIAIQQQFLQPI